MLFFSEIVSSAQVCEVVEVELDDEVDAVSKLELISADLSHVETMQFPHFSVLQIYLAITS